MKVKQSLAWRADVCILNPSWRPGEALRLTPAVCCSVWGGRQTELPLPRPRGPHYSLPLFWWCGRQTCLPACCRSSRTNSPFTRWFPSRCPPPLLTRPSGKGSVSCGWWMAPGSTSALWYKTKRGFKGACVIKYECEMAWGPVLLSSTTKTGIGDSYLG